MRLKSEIGVAVFEVTMTNPNLPVLRASGYLCNQSGMTSAENKENPKINIVLEEFMSVNFKTRLVRLS